MPDPSDSLPSESLADGLETQKPSRLLWWLHPKVALPLLLLGLLLVAPFLYRGYRIASIPDIGDPFDVKAFGTVDIAPADNAMTQYAVATSLLHKFPYSGGDDLEKAFEHGWPQTSAVIRKWLHDNQPALTEWRKGTGCSQAVVIQPKDLRIDSPLEEIQEARQFIHLARLQAMHCAHDGDLEAAWGWLLAAVRASRHVEQNGCVVQRLIGISMFNNAAIGIKRWAEHPEVTADLLRNAQTDFREADQLTPPNSVAMKVEYVSLLNTLKDSESSHECLIGEGYGGWKTHSMSLFVMGEPEFSLRVFQHVFRNYLSELDKPKRDRVPLASVALNLYALPSGTATKLSAFELERVVESAVLTKSTLPSVAQVDIAMQHEAATRAAVSFMLACQLHRRLHGDWPTKVEDLVPDILAEPPADPLGKSGELMRLKRDVDDLVIYSVGLNGVDDGGNIGMTNSYDALDQGIRAKQPSNSQNSTKPEINPPEKP